MFNDWIKVEDAVPPFTNYKEYDNYDPEIGNLLESDEVMCLLEDGDIVPAKYTMFTTETKATFREDDWDFEDTVVAWIPKNELYPAWFTSSKEIEKMVKAMEEGWDNGVDE